MPVDRNQPVLESLGVSRPKSGAGGVSIIIPVFNRKDLTRQCLLSLEGMGSPVPFEVVVVDNGSTDGTAAELQSLQGRLHFSIQIIQLGENRGFAQGCNIGARAASRETLLFLNNDTKAAQDFLARPLALLDAPKVGVVGLKLLYPDDLIQHAGVAFDAQKLGSHIYRFYPKDYPPANQTRAMQAVTGACLFVRKALFEKLGGFDEAYYNGQEDLDFCFKVRQAGYAVMYCPEASLYHLESQSEGRLNRAQQNRALFLSRWANQVISDEPRLLAGADTWGPTPAYPAKFDLPPRLNFALKIGVPDRTHTDWGDIFLAESLANALTAAGYRCVIHYLNEWDQQDRQIHVVVHIKGLSPYTPKPHNFNVLWIINHPELHTVEELNRYDLVFVASLKYQAAIRPLVKVPVYYLPQAADMRYVSLSDQPPVDEDLELLFVGNNYEAKHGRCRAIVREVLALGLASKLKVVGKYWKGYVPDDCILAEFVAPDALPALYRRAKVVLNDHQETMRQNGFINNRTYDLARLKVFQISDEVEGLAELGIATYSSASDLKAKIDFYLSHAAEREAGALAAYAAGEAYTFSERAQEIVEAVQKLADQTPVERHCGACGYTGSDFSDAGSEKHVRCPRCGSVGRVRAKPLQASDLKPVPEVCVLMTTYNRRETLADAVQSVVDQTFKDWQLIVVNDGGSDVQDILEQFADPRIRLINRPHAGKCAALNAAILASSSRYIAYLDDDDQYLPNHLEALISYLRQHSEAKFAYSMAEEVSKVFVDHRWQAQARRILFSGQVASPAMCVGNAIPNLCAVHTRDLFDLAGLFDEKLQVLIDWDMYRRLTAFAPPVFINVKTAEYTRRLTSDNLATGQITGAYYSDPLRYYRNKLRVLRKPALGHLRSLKAAACIMVLTEATKDDFGFLKRYLQLTQTSQLELVVIADCDLDERLLVFLRLADILGVLVLWDEAGAGAEKILKDYLEHPWCAKSLIFENAAQVNAYNLWAGLDAPDSVVNFAARLAPAWPAQRGRETAPAMEVSGERDGISIILAVSGERVATQRCLDAIVRFMPPHLPFEVVAVNVAASADALAYLKVFRTDHAWLSPVIPAPEREGVAAYNLGRQAAKFDTWLFLDSRVEVQCEWLEPMWSLLADFPALGAVGSKVIFPAGTVCHAGYVLVQHERNGGDLVVQRANAGLAFNHREVNTVREHQALASVCLLIRRQAFLEAGGFDRDYETSYGELDLCLKLAAKGWKLAYQPESLAIYYPTAADPEAAAKEARDHQRFTKRWQGRVQPDVTVHKDGTAQAWPHFTLDFHAAVLRQFEEICRPRLEICRSLFEQGRKGEAVQLLGDFIIGIADTVTRPMLIELLLEGGRLTAEFGHQRETRELVQRAGDLAREGAPQFWQERALARRRELLAGPGEAGAAPVDIVVPVYGQAALVQRCVTSVLQTEPRAHLILVDDCSPGSDIATLFEAWRNHPQITLARTPANQGFISACRMGANLGQAPFLLLLNSDIEAVEPGWLEKLIPTDDQVAIVGAKLLYPPDLPGPLAGSVQHAGVARNAEGVPYHPFLGQPAESAGTSTPHEVNAVTGACFLVRRSVWDELGGWDARFGKGVYEDVDFCWQARRKGYRVFYQPAVKLYHHESASTAPDGQHTLNVHTQENLKKLLEKWGVLPSDEDLFFGEKTVRRWERARKQLKRAQTAGGQHNPAVALAALRKALQIADDLPEALVSYAQLLAAQNDHAEAAKYFDKVVQLAPTAWGVRLRLVDEWLAAKQPEKASAELAKVKAVFPQAPEVSQRESALARFRSATSAAAPQPAGQWLGLVDIVVPIYNQPQLVRQCVESVLRTAPQCHLILVDDCSPDPDVAALLEQWRHHPQVTLARTPTNCGFLGTCKYGASLGQAPFILLLNSDTEAIDPGWLDKLVPADERVAIVGAKLLYPPHLPGSLAGCIQHAGVGRWSDGVQAGVYHPFQGWPAEAREVNLPRAVNAVTGACFLIRRRVWDELGGWDDRFGKGVFEDVDLCWQARQKGYEVQYQPGVRLYHYESASTSAGELHPLHKNSAANIQKLLEKWPDWGNDEELFYDQKTVRHWRKARELLKRAYTQIDQKDLAAALAATRQAVELAPTYHPGVLLHVQLLSRQGQHLEAAAWLRKVSQLLPADKIVRSNLVKALWLAAQPEQALHELEMFQAEFPGAPEVRELEALFATHLPPKAAESKMTESGRAHSTPPAQPPLDRPKAAETLQLLLEADDLDDALQRHAKRLDADVLTLVRANAAAARQEGQVELAEGLENLAAYIEQALASQPPAVSERAVETLQMLLAQPDLLATLQAHDALLDADLLTLVRLNANTARADGKPDLGLGLDRLALYIEQAVQRHQAGQATSSAAETLQHLLEAEDLADALQRYADQLDANVLELVRTNAAAARRDGETELAEGLENLAAYIEQALAARPPAVSVQAVERLQTLLSQADLPQALRDHEDWLDADLLALVRLNADTARADGKPELARGLDNLAVYVEQRVQKRIVQTPPGGESRAAETLELLLTADDVAQTLEQNLDRLDAPLVALVRQNAAAARQQGQVELAEGLDTLAGHMEQIIGARQPVDVDAGAGQPAPAVGDYGRASETLEMLLQAEDLPAALEQHQARLDANLLALVRTNAATARADGAAELAEGLEGLAAYIENITAQR
jgi:GT2 family glycosyltransferase